MLICLTCYHKNQKNSLVSMTFHILIVLLSFLVAVFGFEATPRKSIDSIRTKPTNCTSLRAIDFDPKTIFLCTETNSTLLHHSLLDTASRVGGNLVPSNHDVQLQELGISADSNTWLEASNGYYYGNLEPMVPLSGCLDSSHGAGGSLAGEFSINLGTTSSLDLPFLWASGFQPSLVGGVTNDIDTSFTIARQFLCLVPANSTGQIFYRPFRIEVAKPRIRPWTVIKGLRSKILQGNWLQLQKASFYSAATPPQFLCVTDPKELKC